MPPNVKPSDRRRKRPVGCNNRCQILRTVRLSSGAAVRCSALVEQSRLRGRIVERRRFSIGIGFEVARLWEKGLLGRR